MAIRITISIPVVHATSPYERVKTSLAKLREVVDRSTPEQPALGGALYDDSGNIIGSYMVEFT